MDRRTAAENWQPTSEVGVCVPVSPRAGSLLIGQVVDGGLAIDLGREWYGQCWPGPLHGDWRVFRAKAANLPQWLPVTRIFRHGSY